MAYGNKKRGETPSQSPFSFRQVTRHANTGAKFFLAGLGVGVRSNKEGREVQLIQHGLGTRLSHVRGVQKPNPEVALMKSKSTMKHCRRRRSSNWRRSPNHWACCLGRLPQRPWAFTVRAPVDVAKPPIPRTPMPKKTVLISDQ